MKHTKIYLLKVQTDNGYGVLLAPRVYGRYVGFTKKEVQALAEAFPRQWKASIEPEW